MEKIAHESPIVLDMFKNIEKEDSIGTVHISGNILWGITEEECAYWETRAGRCNGIGVRINADAAVLPRERGGVSSRSTADIDEEGRR